MNLDAFASYCWGVLPVTKKTIENYRGAYNRNISKTLGNRQLDSIHQSEFVSVLSPLAPHNYFQTLMTLRVLYREAIIRELVTLSPVAKIKPPSVRTRPQKFLTWEELSSLSFGKYDAQIKFLALHGLRWGEAVALSESDIYDDIVHINKSIYGPTKTSSGVRQVPYFGYFKTFPKSRITIARALKPYGVCIHSLRKTYAYFLKTNGVHVTTAAKFMGHSNPMVTLKIYTLVKDSEVKEIGDLLRSKIQA